MEENEQFCNNCKRPVLSANFKTHSAYCERNISVCKICDEPVPVCDKEQHMEEYHIITSCNLCEAVLEKWMLTKHLESCPKRLVPCEFCDAEFPFDKHYEHMDFCGSRTEKCLLCQKYIMLKDEGKHNELHMYEEKYRAKSVTEEVKQNSVNEIINETSGARKHISKEVSNIKYDGRCPADGVDRRDSSTKKIHERQDASFMDEAKNMISRGNPKLDILTPGSAVASFSNKTQEKSKFYTLCPICKENIRWLDMNTHIPTCASSSGKCSLCCEHVPSHGMKEHMMKQHSMNQVQKSVVKEPQEDVPDFEMEAYSKSDGNCAAENKLIRRKRTCPYCSETYSEDEILAHLRNCAKNSYECALCHGKVLEKDRVHHEKANCKLIHGNIEPFSGSLRSSSQSFYECPMCFENVPEENKEKHVTYECKIFFNSNGSYGLSSGSLRSSSESFYECPMCSENVPEENKEKHVTYECKTLFNSSGSYGLYNMKDNSSDLYQCHLCLESMLVKDKERHVSYECKILIESSGVALGPTSYAEIANTKKTYDSRYKSLQNSSDVCFVCKNRIPPHKMAEHKRGCKQLKLPCLHCNQMIYSVHEDMHLNSCPALVHNQNFAGNKSRPLHSNSKRSPNYEHKGAVPKHTLFKNTVKPETAKCIYCQTTLNANVVKYHEEECVHRPEKCPECFYPVPVKDLENHNCKICKGKGKNKYKSHKKSEDKPVSFGQKFLKFWSNSDNGKDSHRLKYGSNQTQFHIPDQGVNYSYNEDANNRPLYFESIEDDTLIPCEFCGQEWPASELVLHETGCQPDLVSYAKKDSCEGVSSSKLSSKEVSFSQSSKSFSVKKDSAPTNVSKNSDASPFYADHKTFLPSSKYEHIKRNAESCVKSGEFFKSNNGQNSSQPEVNKYHKYLNPMEKKSESLSIHSVWNLESSVDSKTEEDGLEVSDHSDVEVDFVHSKVPAVNKNGKEFNPVSIENSVEADNELSTMLNFINEDKNIAFDEECEIIQDANDEKVKPKSSVSEECSCVESYLSNDDIQVQEKRHKEFVKANAAWLSQNKDISFSLGETIDDESEKMYEEASKSVDNSTAKDPKKLTSLSQRIADFKIDTSIRALSEHNVHHKGHIEKNNVCHEKHIQLGPDLHVANKTITDEELKMYTQKQTSRSLGTAEDQKEYLINFRQRMADFKFATSSRVSSKDENVPQTLLTESSLEPMTTKPSPDSD